MTTLLTTALILATLLLIDDDHLWLMRGQLRDALRRARLWRQCRRLNA